jgi:hypothetical protein
MKFQRSLAARRALVVGASIILGLSACRASAPLSRAPMAAVTPRTILARGEQLAEAKRRIRAGDPALRTSYDALMSAATTALTAGPFTVMDKRKTPPSADKHDFMSLAPYWWPDSTKPGGLPYIRRDGQMNPESRLDHDGTRFQAMTDAVETLSLAYYLSDDARYARRAELLLRVWFNARETRMNPNLQFAQAVLGVNDGRGTGIIDTRVLPQLLDAIRLLDGSPDWTVADREGLIAWCRDYLTWLRESKNGKDERAADNNHGTWYDAQVAALALFVGDTAFAREVLDHDAKMRIAAQIAADGKQKLELERTRPLHYTLFNLDAFTQLAEMGRHVGVDLWHYTAPSGGSLRAALAFVAPYSDAGTPWPTPQVTPAGADVFLLPLRRGALALHDTSLAQAADRLPAALRLTNLSRFAFPDQP